MLELSYKEGVFELVDKARDFVMDRLNKWTKMWNQETLLNTHGNTLNTHGNVY